jgi:ADP-ribosylglycohydrolase
MNEAVKDRIYGAILGSACANSLGGSCIGLNRKEICTAVGARGLKDFSPGLLRSFLPDHVPGTILADTYLAMALAESLIANKGNFSQADLKARFAHLLEDPAFLKSAPGALCLSALRRMADNEEPLDDHSAEAVHDSAAVRAYPIGCLPNKFNLKEIAVGQTKLTHADGRVQAAAAVLANSVHGFINGKRLDNEAEVRNYVRENYQLASQIDERFAEAWDDVAPDLDYARPAHELPYSVINVEADVSEGVPTSVGIFLIFRHSLEEAISQAASSGGDTDTAAAVVGALSGAYHGASAIPERWLAKIAERKRLEDIAEGLCKLW